MSLNVKNQEVLHLVDDLARATGKNKTQVLKEALRDRLAKVRGRKKTTDFDQFMKSVLGVVNKGRKLPVLDRRGADEILGYDGIGVFDGD